MEEAQNYIQRRRNILPAEYNPERAREQIGMDYLDEDNNDDDENENEDIPQVKREFAELEDPLRVPLNVEEIQELMSDSEIEEVQDVMMDLHDSDDDFEWLDKQNMSMPADLYFPRAIPCVKQEEEETPATQNCNLVNENATGSDQSSATNCQINASLDQNSLVDKSCANGTTSNESSYESCDDGAFNDRSNSKSCSSGDKTMNNLDSISGHFSFIRSVSERLLFQTFSLYLNFLHDCCIAS